MRFILTTALGMLLFAASPLPAGDLYTGGRLFDNWYAEIDADFVPDNPDTPELDGRGGPNGNGTLNDANGQAIPNTGHSYRLKNLLGWDLRGNAGIYGADYQAKAFILANGPLNDGSGRADWVLRLARGGQGVPAYQDVLSFAQIGSIIDFMFAVRNGTLPHPDTLWQLSTQSPKGFVMNTGGDAERGRRFYAAQCAYCHGDDATAILFDDGTQSLGQHSRYYGYAIAMKALSGDPGSDMGPQLPAWLSPTEQSQLLLDLVAALCDRERFGVGAATEPDVPDGDPRCGAYLR